MKKKKEQLPPHTSELLRNYLFLPFRTTKIACPYWVNDFNKGIKGPFSGKGTPGQIVMTSYKAAKKLKINLDILSARELRSFLKNNRIGIDCSGFVFHLLNKFDKEKGGDGIVKRYLGSVDIPDWRAAWKVNAEMLTNSDLTRKVKTKEIKPGDIIRLLGGKHIAFTVNVDKQSITYAHCSNYTKVRGCHLGKILLKDWERGLEYQEWKELTKDGKKYKNVTFYPNLGDSIRRPKWWK